MNETIFSSINACPNCKYTNPEKAKFCMQCGKPIESTEDKSHRILKIFDENGALLSETKFNSDLELGGKSGLKIPGQPKEEMIGKLTYEGKKFFLTPEIDSKVYVEATNSKQIEISIGQGFIINGNLFVIL